MGNVELPQWLTELPLAPVFRPTDTEFADPIAYISKIEKEVGAFGICKVIPPLPKPSKKYVFSNLKKSLCRTRELGLDVDVKEWGDSSKRVSEDRGNDGGNRAVFTTRQQELGIEVRRSRGGVDAPQPAAQKQVWQSGEFYTLEQFESKSKAFSRSVLGSVKQVTPLTVEALFWKAASEEAIYVEYANDVPGSGFGEPKGLSRYFNDCRKRRSMSAGGRSSWRQQGVNDAGNLCTGVEEEALELRKECSDLPTSLPDTVSQSAKQRDFGAGAGADLEGTAGWKLSNCPWNLQVIAHSAGSLTRFMMDDIPGVTSPMVYIGMLFSWFAWHVEDHELHSLNFLHTGSPKTWYAVPGEFAFDFEDVIRRQAYGGDLDHLAALKLLGEKTTLLSPEIVVASGIPCCRLVQNPGEFVVTFPRAYHIGFSHGFNCGEAANFGTPQWLTIAKEAAVRRAAMDHLPMLSHQQLLYILTMSFVSSVPKTLLPGVRSSRLRNRLKEERELLVKKAFIEDVLKENHLLNILIGKKSTFRAVLWHPNSLPSLARDSLSQAETILDAVHNKEAELSVPQHKGANEDIHRLNLCGETLNDLYLDCNDILCDFQVDSGTLVCVACGILGYPIMSVIQPSKEASMECFPAENISLTGAVDVLRQPDPCHIQCCTKSSLLGTNNDDTWDASGFLRPRIFCLEHAVQIEELLRPKGGANMLVICHSDYQKIKANAAAVAEEIRTTFNYKEVRFDSASMEELILIDTAIADEQLTDIQEDWTSKLGINLRFSVKTRKGFLPKKIEHALNIDYLLSIMAPVRRILNIQWLSKKARTKREFNHRTLAKYCDGNLPKKDEIIHVTHSMETKGRVLLQYFRRKYRTKSRNCTGAKYTSGGKSMLCSTEVIDADCEKVYDGNEQETSGTCYLNKEVDFEGVDISPVECLSVHEEIEAPEESREPASNKSSEVMVLTEAFNSTSSDSNLLKIAAGVVEELDNANEDLYFENCSSSPAAAMPDAGKSSSTGKDMRVENGCKVEVSDLPIMCWPEELNDEHAAVDLRVSSIPDHAFQKANTPEAPEESREPASNKSSEVMVLTEAFNSTSSDSNLLKIAAGVVEELDNANEDLDFENCSSSPAATMPDAGKSSSTGKDMSVENGCKVEVSDLPIMCRPEELNDEHAAVDLRVSNISDHAFQKSNTPEADCSSVINNSCNKLEIYAKASLNMTEKLGESVTCKHDATTLEVDMPILPKDSLTDSSLTGAWASPLSSRWEEQDEKLATAKITCGYTRKRRRKVELQTEAQNSFIKSPCEGLRPRKNSSNSVHTVESNVPETAEETPSTKKLKKSSGRSASCNQVLDNKTSYKCNVDGCRMRFRTKVEHSLHKRNQCHHKKCGKSFKSHKYAVLHQRVHDDERPLKCSWTGCTVTFKWAWARTEHMRLHTGERPYQCKIKGCGLTFRFVSEFSRHRRKFRHHVNQPTK